MRLAREGRASSLGWRLRLSWGWVGFFEADGAAWALAGHFAFTEDGDA